MARASTTPTDTRAIGLAARALPAAINAGDIEGAIESFGPDAVFVTPDATWVRGEGAIRSILAQLIAQRVQVSIGRSEVTRGGGSSTISEHWTIHSPSPGSQMHSQRCESVLVLRSIAGRWKIVVASPWSNRFPVA